MGTPSKIEVATAATKRMVKVVFLIRVMVLVKYFYIGKRISWGKSCVGR